VTAAGLEMEMISDRLITPVHATIGLVNDRKVIVTHDLRQNLVDESRCDVPRGLPGVPVNSRARGRREHRHPAGRCQDVGDRLPPGADRSGRPPVAAGYLLF
jgi:hypothetical protein